MDKARLPKALIRLGLSGLAFVCLLGIACQKREEAKPKGVTPPALAQEVVTRISDIPTASAEVPKTTPEPTATPTPESVKKPENFLPEYSVFYGEMKKEDGTAKGSVIVSHIPGYPNQLYVFAEANRSGEGYLFDINKTDGNSLEAAIGRRVGGVYVTPTPSQVELENRPKINIALEEGVLVGKLEWYVDRALWSFRINYYGTGRTAIMEAAKKLWAVEIAYAPAEWSRVPETTILPAGFRGIELP